MRRHLIVSVATVLLLFGAHAAADPTQWRALESVVDSSRTMLYWDPYRVSGQLVRGDTRFEFVLNDPIAMVNFREIHRIEPPVIVAGAVRLGPQGWDLIMRLFPPPPVQRRIAAIYIDPGHGGRDPGAIGRHQIDGQPVELREKDVVLDVSLSLARLLRERYPDKKVVLSRNTDVYLTLEERTALANTIDVEAHEAIIFLSIHANASLNANASGFEVWFLPSEYRRRNLVDAGRVGVQDPDVLSILNTLREEEITIESMLLARNILSGIDVRVGDVSPNRGLKEESWYVVRNAKMPSVLIELGFLTHRDEFLRLRDPRYLNQLTQGIYSGVINFVRSFEELQ